MKKLILLFHLNIYIINYHLQPYCSPWKMLSIQGVRKWWINVSSPYLLLNLLVLVLCSCSIFLNTSIMIYAAVTNRSLSLFWLALIGTSPNAFGISNLFRES
jgi:hypothetical protein